MNVVRIVAIGLIVLGTLGLVYGGITYTRESSRTDLGPIDIVVSDKKTINIPIWAGVGAIAVGSVLLLVRTKKT